MLLRWATCAAAAAPRSRWLVATDGRLAHAAFWRPCQNVLPWTDYYGRQTHTSSNGAGGQSRAPDTPTASSPRRGATQPATGGGGGGGGGDGTDLEPRFRYWKKSNRVMRGPSFRHKRDPAFQGGAAAIDDFVVGAGAPAAAPQPLGSPGAVADGLVPLPHFLFAGRANVGKSALISNLLGKKNFARTSSVAGKTDAINTLVVNGEFVLADCPGHGGGHADPRKTATLHVDRAWQRVWRPLVFKFIAHCGRRLGVQQPSNACPKHPLLGLFYLCDIKSPTTLEDREFLRAFREAAPGVPIVLVLTKDDLVKHKWRRHQLQRSICDRLDWDGPILHYTSKQTQRCRNHLRRYITTFLEEAKADTVAATAGATTTVGAPVEARVDKVEEAY